jgi:hypothetical protein
MYWYHSLTWFLKDIATHGVLAPLSSLRSKDVSLGW